MIVKTLHHFKFALLPLYVLLVLAMHNQVYGQAFNVSEVSSRFLHDGDYDSLIRAEALQIATRKNISETDFNARYPEYRYQFAEKFQPLLQSRFTVLDETYENAFLSPGKAGFTKARTRYLREAGDIVRTVFTGTHLFAGLFFPDYNDRILSFHSDVKVEADGDLQVSEFITVFNGPGTNPDLSDESSGPLNDDIKRGIVRDFPTSYLDKDGFYSNTGFSVKGVYKNGEAEPYVTQDMENGTRVRIGTRETLLPPGNYQYRIDYTTNRQLIFHKDKDELYWNVNGNGWAFTMDSVSCNVSFPDGASIKEYACYSGLQGSTDRNCKSRVSGNRTIAFSSSKRLDSYEGLTIAVSIEKGILIAPGKLENALNFLRSNYIIPALFLLLVFLFCFYYFVWNRQGRDPQQGVIFPQFSPPAELSPADLGYIIKQRYGSHLFAAALIDFAVKKHLIIEVEKKGMFFSSLAYHFNRPAVEENIPDTTAMYGFNIKTLYGQTAAAGKYNSTLKACYNALEETLKKRLLIRNGKVNTLSGLFMLNKGYTRFGGFVLVGALITGIFFIISHSSLPLLVFTCLMMVALIIIHIVFMRIMSAYTRRGREIADHILGFRMYLDQAEQRVYDQLTPPEKTLELFEKYLPYAIALEVENSWANKFDNIMQNAITKGYQPAYYYNNGNLGSFSMGAMSRNISSGMSGSISSASTPPGKSGGGSGGGGSSGGGGGGGGGGGW